jgi:hypothetical protein
MKPALEPFGAAALTGALLLLAGTADAQTATLVGHVADPSGAGVPKASIFANDEATNVRWATLSNARGDYVLAQLPPGLYHIRVSAPGFRPLRKTGVLLEVATTLRVDAELELGDMAQELSVREEATVISTETATIGSVVGNAEIVDLPLNGRNFLSLAFLAPGVVPAPAGANPFHVNGSRSDHVTYLLEGAAAMDRRGNEPIVLPSVDAIAEFKVLTNSFSAEYGRVGGGVVTVALKSGANRPHGTVFEFLRNDVFDAKGLFDAEVPTLRRNQFGGVAGGPIVPERAFFLFGYEGMRNREQQTRLTRVPTSAEREGAVGQALDPLTGAAFPDGRIPPERHAPVARSLLPFFPLPNRDGALNFASPGSIARDTDSFVAKIDNHLGPADRISVRFLLTGSDGRNPFRATPVPGFGSVSSARFQSWGINYTRAAGARWINEARLAFGRSRFDESSVNSGRNTSAEAGIAGVAPGYGLANIVIAGYAPLGDSAALPDRWTDNEYTVSNHLMAAAGAHWVRFGGEFQRSQHFNLFAALAGGQLTFLGSLTRNPLGDFLLGLPVAAQRQVGTNKSYLFGNTASLFLQDDWQPRPDLTINAGVRYELSPPPVEKYDRWANFLPDQGRPVRAGSPGYPRSLLRTDWNNLGPRLGLAWRVGSTGSTVVRAGYGIFYALDLQYTMYQLMGASAFPFTRLELFQAAPGRLLRLADPFSAAAPGLTPGASSPNGWEYHNPTTYQHQWNLTLARQVTPSLGVEAAYVGSKGTHLSATLDLNQTIRTPGGPVIPFAGYSRILWQSLGGNGHYQALQVSALRRFSSGLGLRSSFTWSKAIDYASFGSAARRPQNSADLRADRGLADFHRGRTWTNAFLFRLPIGRGRRIFAGMPAPLDLVAGGWQVSGIVHLYDGLPFTPSVAGANAQAGEATRPDRIGSGMSATPSAERWFNPGDFLVVPATAYRFGNSGRNILIGPGKVVFDLAVHKEVPLPAEGHRIQFRFESFNLPNRANLGLPNPAVDQPAAGAIGTADAARQIQLGLKYLF